MTDVSQTPLADGTTIPQLGFGVWQVDDATAEVAVAAALRAGYRHIDTAKLYENERGCGRAIAASGLARDDVDVTTKLWNADQGYDSALAACDAAHGIVTESWSPLGQGQGLLDDPVHAEIAATHDVSRAQVVIAWHMALGLVVIPKSVTPSRIAENFEARTLRLDDDDLVRIGSLERNLRYGFDPDEV